ncbi:glycerol-3-phosphate dehydrogenase-1 [Coleophoma cylindrospora]|uniref:Glycerol-3-phosphate dehydrogenase n=1 Tax=Coleophoma cylindrospora TaxID=1849047 RepID=A0A3D8Q872_9HELO|nr:glycerol-3-phosphate dehydrogenase-1 [Coleophoma cylindrospora]
MSGRFRSSRALKTVASASAVAAVGGTALYAYSRRQHDPRPTVPLPVLNQHGKLEIPQFPRIKTRDEQIADLKRSSRIQPSAISKTQNSLSTDDDSIYDLLVIGGGATGTGIALDAATRGLKVALVERDDFSSGTSSKSTKLIHGGVRYLEKAFWNLDYEQFKLVQEALSERQHFQNVAPHLSTWTPILIPLQQWWQAPYFWAGTKAYDLLAGSQGFKNSYFMSKAASLEAFPMQRKDKLIGSLVYYDGQQNDSRTNIALAMTAALYGTTTVNHLEVTGLDKDSNGKLCGARVRDLIADRNGDDKGKADFSIRAKGIINATGPFVDAIQQMDEPGKAEIVAPSSGVHIILPGHLTPDEMGLIDPSSSDGRVVFLLPWEGCTLAGTTDSPTNISKNPIPSEKDISWVLNQVREYLTPEVPIRRSDVLAAWSGIRPLVRDPNAKNTESLVRNHLVTVSNSGLLTCAGGKWTTYRQMAEDAVDEAVKVFQLQPRQDSFSRVNAALKNFRDYNDVAAIDGSCQTRHVRLIGAHGHSPNLFISLAQHFGFDADVAKHLANSYGDRAWAVAEMGLPETKTTSAIGARLSPKYPFLDSEVTYAIRNEYAQTAIDVLARRTRLSFLDVNAALTALPAVIDVMGEELSWDRARKDLEWKDSVSFLESMGLPAHMLAITREEVLSQKFKQASQTSPIQDENSTTSKPVKESDGFIPSGIAA